MGFEEHAAGTAPVRTPEDYGSLPLVDAIRTILADEEAFTVTKMCAGLARGPAPHSHPHRQVIHMLKGSGLLRLGPDELHLIPGSVVTVEPNVPHAFVYTEEDTEWLEVFTPGREDWR